MKNFVYDPQTGEILGIEEYFNEKSFTKKSEIKILKIDELEIDEKNISRFISTQC